MPYALCSLHYALCLMIEWIWFACLMILTGYHLVIFRPKQGIRKRFSKEWPGVSIVVAHKNDSKFLKENLPLITSQEYPLYEVIIVDDHSLPEEKESLQEIIQTMKEVQLLETELNGKKSALSTGVYAAQYDMIL